MDPRNEKLNDYLTQPLRRLDWAGIIQMVPPGPMLELGVYRGESFGAICALAHPRTVYGFDWWRGLPEDWGCPGTAGQLNMDGKPPPCPDNGVYVVGLVRDTLPTFTATYPPAAFVHFDMDLYSSTVTALHYLKFAPGAILAFDEICRDFRNIDSEQKAFREWLERTDVDFELIGSRHEQSWVIRLLTVPM